MLVRIAIAAVASVLMVTGALSQDGARAYHLLPEGTNIISLTPTFLHDDRTFDPGGFVERSVVDVNVLTPTYRHSIDVFGNAGTILIGMPLGNVSTSLDTLAGTIDLDTGLTHGDLFVGGSLGLVGSPSLSPMDFAQYKPGFRASIATRLFLPTGDYDPDRPLNLGGNRWSLQASLPISYVLGDTMIDPELMTFEIMPVVQIFGDNNDPSVPASVTSQAPIFGLEGHITRNFGNTVWGALDAYYDVGGERSADGVAAGDAKENFALGATLGLTPSASTALRFSYRELIYSNAAESSGRTFEITSAFLF